MSDQATDTLRALSAAHEKLFAKLFQAEESLRRLDGQEGGNWRRIKQSNRLSDEIESLKKRLDRCERLMESSR